MTHDLTGKRVAILATHGFEQSELTSPRDAIKKAGGKPVVVSPESGSVRGWDENDWGDPVDVDQPLDESSPDDFDALVLPGGVMNPDKLRVDETALRFVRGFFEQHKPVAAICHGPWTLINAGVVDGRTVTSYHTIKRDLVNAGANWVDEEVVVDNGLVTSRHPGDLDAFNDKLLEEIVEGKHAKQTT
jgi:protease I